MKFSLFFRPVLTNRFNESNSVKYTFEDIMEKRKVKDSEAFKTIRKLNIFYQVLIYYITKTSRLKLKIIKNNK